MIYNRSQTLAKTTIFGAQLEIDGALSKQLSSAVVIIF